MSADLEKLKTARNKLVIERDRLRRAGRPHRHLSGKLANLEVKIYRMKNQ